MNQRKSGLPQKPGASRLTGQQTCAPQPHQPCVAQPKIASAGQVKNRPIAPPAYRPQAKPQIVQQKTASPAQMRTPPVAPPAYRPQSVPKVLQTKTASGQQSHTTQSSHRPVAPPVYRPEAKKLVQPKAISQLRQPPTAPPVYRPEQKRVAQPKMAAAAQAHTPPKAAAVSRSQPKVNAQSKLPAQMKSKVVAPAAAQARLAAGGDRMGLRAAPHNASVQAKNIASPIAPHAKLQRSNSVIQRVIVIGNQVYTPAETLTFNNTYPASERENMLSAMADFPNYPRSIDQALADARRFYLTRIEDQYGVEYAAEADALPRQVVGGRSREAGKRPVLVTRPVVGFEEVEIKGLIMCVGIVIEARRDGRVQAAAGSHFVTPEMMTDGRINEAGRRLLEMQIQMVRNYGTMTALIMHILGQGGPRRTASEHEGDVAVNQITNFLLDNGIQGVSITAGQAQRSYRLMTDGTSTLT